MTFPNLTPTRRIADPRCGSRATDERRMKRIFWAGLIIPAVACAITALLVGPNSWLGWAAVLAIVPAVATGVAVAFMVQDRVRGH